ncbi:hypothetical protein [Calothrix sp. 336/3]|uniref:hypothetical protein n=1 Tax=Calothrix sp. 336/3 TaxID=1337936 RepID=UPI0004E418DB|nr:hypothetical protein [Calothrix sp. 336/3]AKG22508.1 hypothetical protein IJ00_15625 [Calothrix sp. 336/3]
MTTTAGDGNLVYLTLYIIGVLYTFNRMIESIDEKIQFSFDKASVDKQLQEQELQNDVGIGFRFNTFYDIDELKELSLSVENKSQNIAIYVDWDNSSLVVEHDKQSRRVIRKSPDITRDLAVLQSPSLVAPGKTLSQVVTAEDVFQRDKESGTYKVNSPLVNISKLKSGQKPQKKMYNDFMEERRTFEFSLQLVLRLSEVRLGLAPGVNVPPMCIVNCPFTIKKLPWTYALPWNKKK